MGAKADNGRMCAGSGDRAPAAPPSHLTTLTLTQLGGWWPSMLPAVLRCTDCTVLFCDLEGFTRMSTEMTPDEVVSARLAFLQGMQGSRCAAAPHTTVQ